MSTREPGRSLKYLCWIPAAALVAVEIYVRNFDGWGAWAAAPLFLLPFILSVVITGVGVVQFVAECRAGSARAATALALAVALAPCLWLSVRRYFT